MGTADNCAVSADVVIVAYRSGKRLTRCVRALIERDAVNRVIVVDNGEGGAELEEVAASARQCCRPGRISASPEGCNLGAQHAEGNVFVFLNPDTVIGDAAVSALCRTLYDEQIGVLSALAATRSARAPQLCRLSNPHLGPGVVERLRPASGSIGEMREITYANGSALAIRADLFREVGGFTDEFFIYHEDLELCWKVRMRVFES